MTRKTILEYGADTADITGAFLVRNSVVLVGLCVALLVAFAR